MKTLHNYLIHRINVKVAKSLPYNGCVIDLGCGNAPYKDIILDRAERYIGVDWINSLHDRSNVDVYANLVEGLPFNNNFADTVVSFQVMEHLSEPGRFLSECCRTLKSNGHLFLTVPFMWGVHEEPYDYFRYTRHGLEYLLKQAGFVDIQIEENTGFWQMWVLKFNYHTDRPAYGPLKLFFLPFWLLGQVVAPILDKIDPHPQETASYTVIARK